MNYISQINHILSLIKNNQKNHKSVIKVHHCKKIQKFFYFLVQEGFINGFKITKPWEAYLYLKYDKYGHPAFRAIKKIAFQNVHITKKAYELAASNTSRVGTLVLNTHWGVMTDQYAIQKRIGGRLIAIIY